MLQLPPKNRPVMLDDSATEMAEEYARKWKVSVAEAIKRLMMRIPDKKEGKEMTMDEEIKKRLDAFERATDTDPLRRTLADKLAMKEIRKLEQDERAPAPTVAQEKSRMERMREDMQEMMFMREEMKMMKLLLGDEADGGKKDMSVKEMMEARITEKMIGGEGDADKWKAILNTVETANRQNREYMERMFQTIIGDKQDEEIRRALEQIQLNHDEQMKELREEMMYLRRPSSEHRQPPKSNKDVVMEQIEIAEALGTRGTPPTPEEREYTLKKAELDDERELKKQVYGETLETGREIRNLLRELLSNQTEEQRLKTMAEHPNLQGVFDEQMPEDKKREWLAFQQTVEGRKQQAQAQQPEEPPEEQRRRAPRLDVTAPE